MKIRSEFRLSGLLFGSFTGAFLVVAILAGSPGRLESASPVPGKYSGETGSRGDDGRISFKVDRSRRKISKLFVSAFVLCQDTGGFFTQFSIVATRTDNKKFKLKGGRRFTAMGQDKAGIEYKVKGKLRGSRKFTGTVEVAQVRFFSIPFFPFIDSELCQGSRDWKAKR